MALTRITKGVIKPNENYDTHNINSTGIVTAVGANFSGNVSVGGTLTYEDVTSIDSVGIITARDGIDCNADLDVDGHTNLDNVSVAGVTTTTGAVNLGDDLNLNYNKRIKFNGARTEIFDDNNLRIDTNGTILIRKKTGYEMMAALYPDGATKLWYDASTYSNPKFETTATGVTIDGTAVAGGLDISGDIDVDGHTNLDNVSIAGVTTASDNVTIPNNKKLILGSGASQLHLYHNTVGSSNHVIESTSSSNHLIFKAAVINPRANYFSFRNLAHNQDVFIIDADNSTKLYFNGNTKLTTENTGVNITGIVTATSADINGDLDVDGHTNLDNVSISGLTTASQGLRVPHGSDSTNYISVGNNGALRFWATGHSYADMRAGNLHIRNASLQNVVEFQQDKDAWFYGPIIAMDTVTIPDSIIHSGDSDTKIRFPAADTVTVETAGSERLRIDASGVSSFSNKIIIDDGSNGHLFLNNTSSENTIHSGTTGFAAYKNLVINAAQHIFKLSNTEKLRIDSNGVLKIERGSASNTALEINTTSTSNACRIKFNESGTNKAQIAYSHDNDRLELVSQSGNGIAIYSGGNLVWKFDTNGHLLPNTAGAVNIGSASAEIGNVYVADNKFLYMGSDQDLSIYHNGTHGFIHAATGGFYMKVGNGEFLSRDGSQVIAKFLEGTGGVELYYNNSKKLETTSSGVNINSVGINATTPSAGDLATGASQNAPLLHVYGSGSSATSGAYNLLARFEAGGDADETGAMIVLNHSNDRGLAIEGGRRTGNYAHGALKMIDNVGRVSEAMLIHGGAGQGVDHISFATGVSTTTTRRLLIDNQGNIKTGTIASALNFTDSNSGNTKSIEIGASGGGDALFVAHSSGYGVGYFGYEAGGDRLVIACDGGSGSNKIDFITDAGVANGGGTDNLNGKNPKMRILANGNVGISKDPLYMLDIEKPNSGGSSKQLIQRWMQGGQNTLELHMYGGSIDQTQFAAVNSEQTLSFLTGVDSGNVDSTETTLLMTQNRDLWNQGPSSGNTGGGLFIGRSASPYGNLCALRDSNGRPVVYMAGDYPEINIVHEVPTNSRHGGTIRFATYIQSTNAATGKQFVIGTNGYSNFLDIGYANAGQNVNVHNGIDNHGTGGKTLFRVDSTKEAVKIAGHIIQVGYARNDPNADTYTSISADTKARSNVYLDFTPKYANSKLLIITRMHTRMIAAYGCSYGIDVSTNSGSTWSVVPGMKQRNALDFFYKGDGVNHHYTGFCHIQIDASNINSRRYSPWGQGWGGGTWELSYGHGEHSVTVYEIATTI